MSKCTILLVLALLLGSAASAAASPLPEYSFDYLLTVLERIADRLSAIEDKLSTNYNNNKVVIINGKDS